MATLTDDQIEYIRAMSGDDCLPYYVSDALMQKFFDRALSDECATIVYVLRVCDAKTAPLVNQSNGSTGEGAQNSSKAQKHAHFRTLRLEWEERCGMAGPALDMGTFDLALDADCEDEYQSRLDDYS